MDRQDLFRALVDLCQTYGYTTDTTYDALHKAVDSMEEFDTEVDLP